MWLIAFASIRIWGKQWLPHFMSEETASDIWDFSPIFFMGIWSAWVYKVGTYAVAGQPPGVNPNV
jgi:hypothetical protein